MCAVSADYASKSFSGFGDNVHVAVTGVVLSHSPSSATQTEKAIAIPASVRKVLHDFLCAGLKDGATKADIVNTTCQQVHNKVKIVPEDICAGVLSRLWEHEEVGHCQTTPVKAAELRRWDNSDNCTGNYTVLNHDNMNECSQKMIPAPASIWVEQKNATAYSSFHCQGVLDCSKDKRVLLADFIVGTCEDLGGYSQMRMWIKAESPSMLVI
jgi:hypothetical protein